MCKTRIEDAAKGKGVAAAKWSSSTKILQLTFDPSKTSVDRVQDRIVSAGHDAADKKASEAAYKRLPDCCLYRTKSTHSDAGEHDHGEAEEQQHDDHAADLDSKTITGFVVQNDKGTAKPLAGATVAWLGIPGGTTTDTAGPVSYTHLTLPTKRIV